MRSVLGIIVFCLLAIGLRAQEVLCPLQKSGRTIERKGEVLVLGLPFFDDFSYAGSYPDAARWTDQNTFVNESFAVNPPSVGCVSFDALDASGAIYESISNYTSAADTLSSQAFDLAGQTDVALSFWYQAGGLAPAPETNDSLVLQFYAPSDDRWISVWKANGGTNTDFRTAFVRVDDVRFLQSGFRFRFLNFVSLGTNDNTSLLGNNDYWNLDMVYLDANRMAVTSTPPDMCFTQNLGILLQNYTSVPWKHFQKDPSTLMAHELTTGVSNYSNLPRNIGELSYRFVDKWGNKPDVTVKAGSYDLTAGESWNKVFPLNSYTFESSGTDSACVEVHTQMSLDETDFYDPNNDIVKTHIFKDYYAYDDGVPETGYGLKGNHSSSGLVALKYTNTDPQQPLWAVDMFLTRTLDKANLKYFILTVWADNNGEPGEVLYSQPLAETIGYQEGLGAFNTFRLHESLHDNVDTAIMVGSSYYIGWEQVSEVLLGVGMDFNHVANDKLFYNLGSGWVNSEYKGALMLRPVFSNRPKSNATPTETVTVYNLKVYPNPAQTETRVRFDEAQGGWQAILTDLSGRKLMQQQVYDSEWVVPVNELSSGIYLLRAVAGNGHRAQARLVVTH